MTTAALSIETTEELSFSRRLGELISELAASPRAGRGSEAGLEPIRNLLVEADIKGELGEFDADRVCLLCEFIADGLAARGRVSPEEIDLLLRPVVWGLLDRTRF